MALPELLAPLVGTWRGPGHGEYPTIRDFDYDDELTFADLGKPFLAFTERTWMNGEPRHTETGYWRMPAPGVVELVAALPTGQAEVGVGTATLTDGVLAIETDAAVANTPTAKRVDRVVRRLTLEGDRLHYEVLMAAVGRELTLHLTARLVRV